MSGISSIEAYAMPVFAQLPVNIAKWKIDPQRAVLLVHDLQRYFIQRIPFEHPRSALLKNTSLVRERCINVGIPVAYTSQAGKMTESQQGLLKDFWGAGMKVEPRDRQVVDELAPGPEDWLFTKWRYSAFYRSNLLQRMRDAGRDQLIICGVYAHVGVLVTAIEAFSHDIETFLIADALADFSLTYHLMALDYVARCCGVVLLTHEVLAYL